MGREEKTKLLDEGPEKPTDAQYALNRVAVALRCYFVVFLVSMSITYTCIGLADSPSTQSATFTYLGATIYAITLLIHSTSLITLSVVISHFVAKGQRMLGRKALYCIDRIALVITFLGAGTSLVWFCKYIVLSPCDIACDQEFVNATTPATIDFPSTEEYGTDNPATTSSWPLYWHPVCFGVAKCGPKAVVVMVLTMLQTIMHAFVPAGQIAMFCKSEKPWKRIIYKALADNVPSIGATKPSALPSGPEVATVYTSSSSIPRYLVPSIIPPPKANESSEDTKNETYFYTLGL